MISIRGHIENGAAQFDEPVPADWPEGTKIEARLAMPPDFEQMTEANWPTTPEGIQELLAWADSLQPFLQTEEQEREFESALDEQKAWELSNWETLRSKIAGDPK